MIQCFAGVQYIASKKESTGVIVRKLRNRLMRWNAIQVILTLTFANCRLSETVM